VRFIRGQHKNRRCWQNFFWIGVKKRDSHFKSIKFELGPDRKTDSYRICLRAVKNKAKNTSRNSLSNSCFLQLLLFSSLFSFCAYWSYDLINTFFRNRTLTNSAKSCMQDLGKPMCLNRSARILSDDKFNR